jgi:nucleotide-binding universal stress UspA family protein
MTSITSVLCPVDFSDGSRGALRYASIACAHFGARLTLLGVNDPLLAEAAHLAAGGSHLESDTVKEMQKFYRQSLGSKALAEVDFEVTSGKPASEILRVSRARQCDLIVMSSHGASGFRKLFFGSTTERVLRETTVPTLVTSGNDPGPTELDDIRKLVRRIVVPVDLTPATPNQLSVAAGVAKVLGVPLLLIYVIEPVRPLFGQPDVLHTVENERRYRIETELEQLTSDYPEGTVPETLIVYGEPAEEIAKVASDREVGLIIMGLHSSPLLGPRMGSVTYRVLCLAHRPVLALPPQADASTPIESEQTVAREA